MADFVDMVNASESMTELATIRDAIVDNVSATNAVFCSFIPETVEDKKRLFNLSTGESEPIIEHTKKPIGLCDVVIEPVNITNDDGSVSVCPRISILAADGKVYVGTSWGLYRALQRIHGLYGTLHFDAKSPLKFEAIRVKTKKGQTINLKLL